MTEVWWCAPACGPNPSPTPCARRSGAWIPISPFSGSAPCKRGWTNSTRPGVSTCCSSASLRWSPCCLQRSGYSAHGISPTVREEARRKRLKTIDATCPLVTKVHLEAIHYAKKHYTIILIGHEEHDETIGTLGEAPGAIRLVGSREEAEAVEVPDPDKVAYLTQTTLSLDDTHEIVEVLKRRFPNMVSPPKGDICYATQNRQDAVRAMAPHVDALLVLGAPNSSNSLRLCEVGRAHNVPSYLIERAMDIQLEWLSGVRVLGLTASASAPEILVREVVDYAREKLGVTAIEEFETVQEDVNFPLPVELKALLKSSRPDLL